MFDTIAAALEFGETIIEKIWPDPAKQAEERRKLLELSQTGDLARLNAHVQLMLGQIKTNQIEAQHKSLFVAGWRPAVGWVCVSILAFNYIGIWLLEYLAAFFDSIPETPPRMDMSELWPVLLGMLGVGGMRSFDKHKGSQTDSLGKR